MPFTGGCHCGAVTFTVAADLPTTAMSCNCSLCRRKGMLLAFFPAGQFSATGEASLTTYQFNRHTIEHRFCAVCGVQPFAFGKNPDGSDARAINLRCVTDLDLDTIEIKKFDGASR
jgi:hypothetical protein